MGRLFLTEWIRDCFIDEGMFELDLEESRLRHEKIEGRDFHVREQDEETHRVRKEWSSGENQERTRCSVWDKSRQEKWGSWGLWNASMGPKWEGPRVLDWDRALFCGWWVTTEGFRRIHLAVVCREE